MTYYEYNQSGQNRNSAPYFYFFLTHFKCIYIYNYYILFCHKRNWALKWVLWIACVVLNRSITPRCTRLEWDARSMTKAFCCVWSFSFIFGNGRLVHCWAMKDTQRGENSEVFGSSATHTDLYLQESIKWKARVTLGDRQADADTSGLLILIRHSSVLLLTTKYHCVRGEKVWLQERCAHLTDTEAHTWIPFSILTSSAT